MDGSLVGRDAVLNTARRHLDGSGTVLLEGAPGIGKTAVWRTLVGAATADGWCVLSCAPTETETELPCAALSDLLGPLADRIADLPPPQRRAVEAAVVTASGQVDERALGVATRSLLDAAGVEGQPVLVAVDDVQWLDRASERALRYALRRLDRPVGILVTRRTVGPVGQLGRADTAVPQPRLLSPHLQAVPSAPVPHRLPLGLDLPAAATRLHRVELAPLDPAALHRLLRDRFADGLTRPLLIRISRASAGNPLLAVELARDVLRLPGPPRPDEDLPVTASVRELITRRLAALSPPARRAVRLAALLAVPRLSDLETAGVSSAAMDESEEAGLVVVTESAVRFPHPIYPAAIRATIPPGVCRKLHTVLARAVKGPDERARHLARCTQVPDSAVAGQLAEAAHRQRVRGSPETAAHLYDRAAALTPAAAVADRGRLRLAAIQCRFDSGEYLAAGAAAELAAGELTGELRAEALLLRAVIAWCADDLDVAVSAAEHGLAEAVPDSRLAGRIHAHLGLFQDVPGPALQHARTAIGLLEGHVEDRSLLSAALLHTFLHEIRVGGGARTELLDRALALEPDDPSWLAASVPAIYWKAVDEHELARHRLDRLLRQAAERGDEPSQHEMLCHLGETELLAGRWADAERHIRAARELGDQLGTGLVGETWLGGLLAVCRGRAEAAERALAAGRRRAADTADHWCRRINRQLAGVIAVSTGRYAEAAHHFAEFASMVDRVGLAEPLGQRFEPDWVEACAGAGQLDVARMVVDRLEQRHRRLPRPWTLLGLARSRALLDSATGTDPGPALAEVERARAAVAPQVVPLDRARCLLASGVVLRRARRRRSAREALTGAIDEFEALGADGFARRARAELARVGGRAPGPAGLTPTEERVARLAAAGGTTRAIADALFLSPKTVEANLSRIYRKLGISRRGELSAVLPPARPSPAVEAGPVVMRAVPHSSRQMSRVTPDSAGAAAP